MASYDFSTDILFEILSRADLKTMKKCRVLSKECKDLTYESNFMRLHSQRTSTMVGYLVQSSRLFGQLTSDLVSGLDPKPTQDLLNFLPQPGWIVPTVNGGLVLCTPGKRRDDPFYICKPTTQQWEVVPSPNPRFWTAKISMLVLGSNPLWFKIVRLSDSRDDTIDLELDLDSEYSNEEDNFNVFSNEKSWHCEIFESKSWEWRQSDDLKLTHNDYFECNQDVSACGALHWLVFNDKQDKYTKYTMLSFDGDKEEWAMTSLPHSLRGNDHCDQIAPVSCEGKIGLIHLRQETKMLDVWILNYEKIWIKKHTINLKSLHEKVPLPRSRVHSLYGVDTLFMVDVGSVSFYNFRTRKLTRIRVGGWIKSAYFIQTDSEPVKLKPE
ncbi:hypothetical protein ES288_D04G035700v1 [Gossypium darwinii]|uniref:F-box associated beta-propeller type 1 domain-containing protein n=1 Tax=Gossypium darwinii TaxID=34276 RepID=A0A5D2CX61_GOSDA|nr:hypothetical protein ES288_D04G035700v1 [Gossypium darwinii]